MAKFFNYFPKTLYSNANKPVSLDAVTNIVSRFAFEEKLKGNSAAFYRYSIQDGDTPDIIARKFYGSSERHWIVLMFNDIVDPLFDWPLPYREFNEFVDKKYSGPEYANTTTPLVGLEWANQNIHSYYEIFTRTTSEGSIVEKIQLYLDDYNNVVESSTDYLLEDGTFVNVAVTKSTLTYYQFEQEENEKKRNIKLLKPEFISAVEKEFKRVISQ